MSKLAVALATGGAFWLAADLARAAEAVPPGSFARLHALVKPSPGEDRWAEVPWQTSLWQARRKAAELGKPILLWEMDGHPLGCT
jgi:hypothetical protein